MRRAAAMTLALLAAAGCGEPGPEALICAVGAEVPDAANTIGCARDYDALGYEDSPFVTFSHTTSVNVLIDRQDGDQVYFLDSEEWWLHFDSVYFVLEGHPLSDRGTPAYASAHAQFNALNYQSALRRYVLAKLVIYHDQGKLVVELAAGDNASADLIVDTFEIVRARLYDGERLLYRPVSNNQELKLPELEGRLPIIRSAELFAGQIYQPLNPTTGYGYLRFRRAAQLEGDPVLPVDIVVLDRVPADIQVVSGIVTAEFQTPLSHINILAMNRGTPNMAVREAWDDPTLRAFEGQLVKLVVAQKDFAITAATLAEAEPWWDGLRPDAALTPPHDDAVTGIVDLRNAGATASAPIGASAIGAKAANFAEMMRITQPRPLRLPLPAFALPFSAFDAHLTANGLWPLLEAIVAEWDAGTLDLEALAGRLFELRWAVFDAPMDAGLQGTLATTLAAQYAAAELRMRSSTNVEDLAEFSGAGLYTSVGVSAAGGAAAIERAVKVVWASAFNPAAFVERDFYRVVHREVRMAVLIHPAFEDELANGVALTMNEFTTLRPAFYINSQAGEVSVTNPTGLAVPEQILWYTWYDRPEYEVLSRSSLTGGAPVMAEEDYVDLGAQLQLINARFRPIYCQIPGTTQIDPNCAMDVEWKLASDGLVYVKQARPLRGAQ